MSFKVKDHYFKQAKKDNFLARSVYKLEEIDKKFKVISPQSDVVDLGYFPGSWIQYTLERIGKNGKVTGVDIQGPNESLGTHPQVELFLKDVFEIKSLSDLGREKKFDLLLSDMAPKTMGIKSVDQDRSYNLVEQIFYLMPTVLAPGSNCVIKFFESSDIISFFKEQQRFEKIHFFRPKSTRSTSKESFFIGLKLKEFE